MDFEIVGPIRDPETIAAGRAILQLKRLRRRYGTGRWRKRKGRAKGASPRWHGGYEAHGIGRREFKIKFPLLD